MNSEFTGVLSAQIRDVLITGFDIQELLMRHELYCSKASYSTMLDSGVMPAGDDYIQAVMFSGILRYEINAMAESEWCIGDIGQLWTTVVLEVHDRLFASDFLCFSCYSIDHLEHCYLHATIKRSDQKPFLMIASVATADLVLDYLLGEFIDSKVPQSGDIWNYARTCRMLFSFSGARRLKLLQLYNASRSRELLAHD